MTACVALAFLAGALHLPPCPSHSASLCHSPLRIPLRQPSIQMSSLGGAESKTWWEERGELPFSCTECGKCCQVSGDVWCTPKEAQGLADHLGITSQEMADQYAKLEVEGWLQLRSKQGPDGKDVGCIFLDDNNKGCTVYPARPIQCSTYPFFPRFLRQPESWNSEVVLPGEDPGTEDNPGTRYWSAESGGCEGMREVTDVRYNQKKRAWKAKIKEEEQGRNDTVSADEVMFKLKMYERSFLTFPHEALLRKEAESKDTGIESSSSAVRNSLGKGGATQLPSQAPQPQFYDQIFAAASMVDRELASMKRESESPAEEQTAPGSELGGEGVDGELAEVMQATLRWAEKHVVRLGLCPHAKKVLEGGGMKTLVRSDITEEEDAWRLFLAEAEQVIETEESVLPTTLLVFPNLYADSFEDWHDFTLRLEDQLDEGGELEHIGDHVLIAAFHPKFEFAGLVGEEKVLSYEKRAPYPVINLLRTGAIDRGIEQGITAETIAEHNEKALLAEGLAEVERNFKGLSES